MLWAFHLPISQILYKDEIQFKKRAAIDLDNHDSGNISMVRMERTSYGSAPSLEHPG